MTIHVRVAAIATVYAAGDWMPAAPLYESEGVRNNDIIGLNVGLEKERS
jgi:hypothetical protein